MGKGKSSWTTKYNDENETMTTLGDIEKEVAGKPNIIEAVMSNNKIKNKRWVEKT